MRKEDEMSGYYERSIQKLLKVFHKYEKDAYSILRKESGDETAQKVIREAEHEYRALIPRIPFIGGKRNLMSNELLEAVRLLAFHKTMKQNGFSYEDAFKIVYRLLEQKLVRIPNFARKLIGRLQLSVVFRNRLVKQSERNRKSLYPENFAFRIVTGEGRGFDWGIEFEECAILKFFKAQGAEEFMPYICPNDFLVSKYFGLGLRRTMTLAAGASRCDQYMKKGRETKVVLPTNIAL